MSDGLPLLLVMMVLALSIPAQDSRSAIPSAATSKPTEASRPADDAGPYADLLRFIPIGFESLIFGGFDMGDMLAPSSDAAGGKADGAKDQDEPTTRPQSDVPDEKGSAASDLLISAGRRFRTQLTGSSFYESVHVVRSGTSLSAKFAAMKSDGRHRATMIDGQECLEKLEPCAWPMDHERWTWMPDDKTLWQSSEREPLDRAIAGETLRADRFTRDYGIRPEWLDWKAPMTIVRRFDKLNLQDTTNVHRASRAQDRSTLPDISVVLRVYKRDHVTVEVDTNAPDFVGFGAGFNQISSTLENLREWREDDQQHLRGHFKAPSEGPPPKDELPREIMMVLFIYGVFGVDMSF